MRKIVLGKTNCEVSAISLGTWAFGGESMSGKFSVGWSGQTKENSEKTLKKAWEVGINHWDTADVYGDGKSETIIGSSWSKIPRNDIFIATKFGWDRGPYKEWYNPKHIKNNFERSLRNLKVDCIDLLYLHHCSFGKNDELLDDAMSTIRQFQAEGKVRFLGLSDWSSKKIFEYIKICRPDVIQPYFNVMDDQYITSGLKKYVDDNNIGACFFSPIKHGLLTGKYSKPTSFEKGDHRSRIEEFKNLEILEKLKSVVGASDFKFDNVFGMALPESKVVADGRVKPADGYVTENSSRITFATPAALTAVASFAAISFAVSVGP